jgi:hypothetical protein
MSKQEVCTIKGILIITLYLYDILHRCLIDNYLFLNPLLHSRYLSQLFYIVFFTTSRESVEAKPTP